MRNNNWLHSKLYQVWGGFFNDIPQKNDVVINFKGRWKTKYGHITLKNNRTEIIVNGLFKDERVPEYIITLTIAHELTHYAHGFQSPLPRLYRYPHAKGVVRRELLKRGFKDLLKEEKNFSKGEWPKLYSSLISSPSEMEF